MSAPPPIGGALIAWQENRLGFSSDSEKISGLFSLGGWAYALDLWDAWREK